MNIIEAVLNALLNLILTGAPGTRYVVGLILFATVAVLIILATHS